MKKIIITAFTLSLTILHCFAQNNWKPGYIITNSGDTIQGLIDNRNSQSNSQRCYFREDLTGGMKVYEPQDISGYRYVEGKFYISKLVPFEGSDKRVFLEYVINGGVDIFHFKDELDYFYIEKDGKMYELKNSIVTRKTEGTAFEAEKNVELEKKEYIGVLSALLSEANMQQKIINSRLDLKSLKNIAKEYHDRVCAGETCIIYEKEEKIHFRWGIQFGQTLVKLNFADRFITKDGINSFFGFRFKFENVLDWTENVSFSADVTLQRVSKCEIQQKNYTNVLKYNGVYYDLGPGNKMDVDLKALLLKIPLTVNYYFSQGKIRPYINLGISNTFVLSQNKDFQYLDWIDHFNGKSMPTRLILGFVGKAGAEFVIKNNHTIFTDFGYDFSTNAETGAMVFENTMYSFTIGYMF
jgi:hypothetical protein